MTEKEIWDKAYKRIFELYGNMPDLRIVSRFYSEKQAFMQYEVGKYFYDLAKLRREAEDTGERLIVKNAVASCLVAYVKIFYLHSPPFSAYQAKLAGNLSYH